MAAKKKLIVSIICAAAAVALVLSYAASVRADERVAREEALARYGGEQIEVCVASRDIAAGETLSSSNMKTVVWLADLLPEECVTDMKQVQGAKTGMALLANEPISSKHLAGAVDDIDVPAGFEAVSVPVTDVRAVGGALSRGSEVDIYVQTTTGASLIGNRLLVLETSADTGTSTAKGTLSWVTLAVKPESVQEVLNASRVGDLHLTLPSVREGGEGDE